VISEGCGSEQELDMGDQMLYL